MLVQVCRIACLVAMVIAGAYAAQSTDDVPVRDGRPIQCDGFLMEWRDADAKAFAAGTQVRWDVVRTIDGIAGYIRAADSGACRLREVRLMEPTNPYHPVTLTANGPATSGASCVMGHDSLTGERIVEFEVPWQALPTGARTQGVRLGLLTMDSCGTVLGAATIELNSEPFWKQVLTPKLQAQVALIAVLLVLYFVFYLRIRRRRSRPRQSPHQSA